MTEGDWHKQIREKLIAKYKSKGFQIESSHENQKLPLFYDEVRRENWLSDADIIVIKDGKITEIIEVQENITPKAIIGIIATTNLANLCKINGTNHELKEVVLRIIIKEQKEKSMKNEQFKLIKDILQLQEGCLRDFEINSFKDIWGIVESGD